MDSLTTNHLERSNCAICGFIGVDVRIQGCGCLVHARCVPITSIIKQAGLTRHEKQPVTPGECPCPACHMAPVNMIQVLPLNIEQLDRAVELRKRLSREMADKMGSDNPTDRELADAQAEASYLLLSHGNSTAALCTDNEYQRTGRWTDDEMIYTNFLMEAFDEARLPIESGLKLNEFLSDALLCKSSRLTKKMKNARLSTRSYEFRYPVPALDVQMLSSLEQKFLQSIASEPSRLELAFNIQKHWRLQLSNLCQQIGSTLLDNQAWIASLQEIERRAIEAEEKIRQARRKRIGLAIRRDADPSSSQSFASETAFQPGTKKIKIESRQDFANSDVSVSGTNSQVQQGTSQPQVVTSNSSPAVSDKTESLDGVPSVDFGRIFDRFVDDPGLPAVPRRINRHCGPFLEEIIGYMEHMKLPFHHVDIWVPSYTADANGKEAMRLFHAGHATRPRGLDKETFCRLTEFGEYSKNFNFCDDEDLPGRVFFHLQPRWVRQLDQADPALYGRSQGAKTYGIKTGFGFPLQTAVVDRIIVCLYSTVDVPENPFLVNKCQSDLAKLLPEPKWKLVVEMGEGATAVVPSQNIPSTSETALVSRGSISSRTSSYSSHRRSSSDEDVQLDYRMASLLGANMPNLDDNSENPLSLITSIALPHFISLQNLLLTPSEQRSTEENNLIELLRKSFSQFSSSDNNKNRSNQVLALLIVKEWQNLQSTLNYNPRDCNQGASCAAAQTNVQNYSSGGPHNNPVELDDFTPYGTF